MACGEPGIGLRIETHPRNRLSTPPTGGTVTTEFERDTAVERVDEDRFTAEVADNYGVIDGAPNGGYLTALAGRALGERLDLPHPLTVTTHYLAPPAAAPVEIVTEAMKDRGRHRTGSARVLQDGREVLRVTGTFADLAQADGPTHVDGKPPSLPPVEECLDAKDAEGLPPIFHRIAMRPTAESVGWALGKPRGEALFEGWTGLPDTDTVPPVALLLLADAVPPPVFGLGIDVAWVPTIELTVHVRGIPAPGMLAMRFWSRFLIDGYLETDGEIWDSTGRLVCQARQLALAPRPR